MELDETQAAIPWLTRFAGGSLLREIDFGRLATHLSSLHGIPAADLVYAHLTDYQHIAAAYNHRTEDVHPRDYQNTDIDGAIRIIDESQVCVDAADQELSAVERAGLEGRPYAPEVLNAVQEIRVGLRALQAQAARTQEFLANFGRNSAALAAQWDPHSPIAPPGT